MVEQKSSLLERLKICWNVLTKKNYVYFGIGKDPIIWNDDNTYNSLNSKSLKAFSSISYDYRFNTYKGIQNLHDVVWSVIEKFAKEAQEEKY